MKIMELDLNRLRDLRLKSDKTPERFRKTPGSIHYVPKTPKQALSYLKINKAKVSPEEQTWLEKMIAKDPVASLQYASYLGKRWYRGEKKILQSPELTYMYVKFVVKKVWREGEATLKTDPVYWEKYKELFEPGVVK